MDNLRWQKKLRDEGKEVPRMAADTNALVCPKYLQDWLKAESRNVKRRVHIDADGFLTYTYNIMVSEKVFKSTKKKDGTCQQSEKFSYLLCTHLTPEFVLHRAELLGLLLELE